MQEEHNDETVFDEDIPRKDDSINAYLLSADGRKINIRKASFTIGRSPGCDHSVSDKTVSRIHCRIVRLPQSYILEDLGSSGGTKINDLPIKKSILRDKDKIGLGKSTDFTFRQEE